MSDDAPTFAERFRAVRLLGRGAMGAVYEVEDQHTVARVALKLMLDPRPARVRRFKREFRAVADLHHPNLLELHELFVEDDRWFFTMELIDGQSLRDSVLYSGDAGTLSEVEVVAGDIPSPVEPTPAMAPDALLRVVPQIIEGLGHLHAHTIIHCDLKPSNVLVGLDGRVRLADFGLASLFDPDRTVAGSKVAAGTRGYMAPELFRGYPPSPKTDLYALGCVVFELATGQLPYPSVADALSATEAPRIDNRVRGVPEHLVTLCAELIAADPDARPTLLDCRDRLDACGRTSWAPPRTVFVGRQPQLQRLHAHLDDAEGGAPQVVTIEGASGLGKSSLAARCASNARRRGFVTVTGRCHARERVPFAALDQIVDQLVERIDDLEPETRAGLAAVFGSVEAPSTAETSLKVPSSRSRRSCARRSAAGRCW